MPRFKLLENRPLRWILLCCALSICLVSIQGCTRVRVAGEPGWRRDSRQTGNPEIEPGETVDGSEPGEGTNGSTTELERSIDAFDDPAAAPETSQVDEQDWILIEEALKELEQESNSAYREIQLP